MILSLRWLSLLLALAGPLTAFSQPWDTIPLHHLAAFRSPSPNWGVAAAVSAHPFGEMTFDITKGSGILVNDDKGKERHDIYTVLEHGDIDLEFEFMLPPGSNSGVYLQSRYEIQLLDSWKKTYPNYGDLGGIYQRWDDSQPRGQEGYQGYAPRINAARAPGTWQKMVIHFQAPKFDAYGRKTANARILLVQLNGATLHENVELTGPTRGAPAEEVRTAPLRIQGDHGPVAFRNLRYRNYTAAPLRLSNLRYEYAPYEGDDLPDWSKLKAEQRAAIPALTHEVINNDEKLALRYTGELELPTTGDYFFDLIAYGKGELRIDGKPVARSPWRSGHGNTHLTAGRHQVELIYSKLESWYPKALGLYVAGPGLRQQPLHLESSLAYGSQARPIFVDFAGEPVVLRSFMDLPVGDNQRRRLTHSVNVGLPAKVAYTYDTKKGNLVQVWRGEFLDATPMWNSRGDGSARPLGSVVRLDTLSSLIAAVSTDSLRSRGYRIDKDGVPVFRYDYAGYAVEDKWQASSGGLPGLSRELSWTGTTAAASWRLATGRDIREVEKGLYAVDQTYFIRLAPKADVRLEVRPGSGVSELIAHPTAGGKLQYDLLW